MVKGGEGGGGLTFRIHSLGKRGVCAQALVDRRGGGEEALTILDASVQIGKRRKNSGKTKYFSGSTLQLVSLVVANRTVETKRKGNWGALGMWDCVGGWVLLPRLKYIFTGNSFQSGKQIDQKYFFSGQS